MDKLDAKSNEIPKIRSKKDLIKYLIKCCEDGHTVNGKSEEAGEALDKEGKKVKLFTFKGIVFRGDKRPPEKIKEAGGFESYNKLSDPKNMQEARGLGEGKGATGKSGVSCADQFTGATGYFDPSRPNEPYDGGRLYIIDTTKLDPKDQPYYMKDILLKNEYKETDQSGGEVNITNVPYKAIIGWVKCDYYSPKYTCYPEKSG